ncbi:two-component sensor histidine kinase [Clostridia bacterium]|nr:two-component sensor histidine kinase [Clostridia bacterium]
MRKIKRLGIAARLLILMIAFIITVFGAVFFGFNYFLKRHVENEITTQLSRAVNDITSQKEIFAGRTGYITIFEARAIYDNIVRTLRESGRFSDVLAIVYVDETFERMYPSGDTNDSANTDEADVILGIAKNSNIGVSGVIYRTAVNRTGFYLTCLDLGETHGLTGISVIFYTGTEKYDIFTGEMFAMLLAILAVGSAICVIFVMIISRSISNPLRKLSDFADSIGRGDFTARKLKFFDREFVNLAERMNGAAEKLAMNDEEQKTFFQNVSHELKTPLMSVKGYAEGLKFGVFADDDEKEEAAGVIIAEADRLNALVSDLLYISKIDSDREVQLMAPASLNAIAASCAEKLKGLLVSGGTGGEKRITLNLPKQDIFAPCDEPSFIRAVMNVAANCLQYAASEVVISTGTDNDGHAFIKIRDDGHGISDDDLPNIFKRFYKGKEGKHGIGLAITKSIADRHNAVIEAGNDNGAVFTITFAEK